MDFDIWSYVIGVAVGALSVGLVWTLTVLFPTDCDELRRTAVARERVAATWKSPFPGPRSLLNSDYGGIDRPLYGMMY